MSNKVAAALLMNEKNEILLQLRDNKKTIDYPGYWGTLGGHCEENEEPVDALKRELKEEINFDVKESKFIGILDDGVKHEVHLFKVQIRKKVNEITLNEGRKIEYFAFPKVLDIKIPARLREFFLSNKKEIFNHQ